MQNKSPNTPDLIVISSITGSDRTKVLKQTAALPKSAPSKESPDYSDFIAELKKSPANVVSTILKFLQSRASWNINSSANYQAYVNQFDGAPFIERVVSGASDNNTKQNDSVETLITDILATAMVPNNKRSAISECAELFELFKGDFQNSPKKLHFITQNLDQSDGALSLTLTNYTADVSYIPGKKKLFSDREKPPTYESASTVASVVIVIKNEDFFAENIEMFLGFGFTRLDDWIENASTFDLSSLSAND